MRAIPDYSVYSAPQSKTLGIHSKYSAKYSGIGITSQSNGCLGLFLLLLIRNRVNRTYPYNVPRKERNLSKPKDVIFKDLKSSLTRSSSKLWPGHPSRNCRKWRTTWRLFSKNFFFATGEHHFWLLFQKMMEIPDYSVYSAPQSKMLGIHSTYSGIGIASQSNSCLGLFRFLIWNRVNRTHPCNVPQKEWNLSKTKMYLMI